MTKKTRHSINQARAAALRIADIAARSERARTSQKAKRQADKDWSTLTLHAAKLGIDTPRRGTFFNISEDARRARQIRIQLRRIEATAAPATWEQWQDEHEAIPDRFAGGSGPLVCSIPTTTISTQALVDLHRLTDVQVTSITGGCVWFTITRAAPTA